MIPLKIKVQIQRRKWWLFQRKEYVADLAQSWEEIPIKKRLICLRILLTGDTIINKMLIIKTLVKWPKWLWLRLPNDDWSALIDAIAWMKIEPSKEPIITAIIWKGETYMLPSARFDNGTAVQFPLADKYLQDFTDKGNEEDLLKLVAALCLSDDNNKLVVEKRAELLRGLPQEIQIAVMLYFIGIKQFIAETYGEYLFDEEEEDDLAVRVATAHFPNFGWWAAYLQIAESGVFGSYEQVLQTNFHRVIMYLIEKRKESKRMKAVYESQKQI